MSSFYAEVCSRDQFYDFDLVRLPRLEQAGAEANPQA
jgi:hypothetical protein